MGSEWIFQFTKTGIIFFSKGKLGGKERHKNEEIWEARGEKGGENFKECGDLATWEDEHEGFSHPCVPGMNPSGIFQQ